MSKSVAELRISSSFQLKFGVPVFAGESVPEAAEAQRAYDSRIVPSLLGPERRESFVLTGRGRA